MPVDQLQRQLGVRLFFVLHLTWLGVIILVRKKQVGYELSSLRYK